MCVERIGRQLPLRRGPDCLPVVDGARRSAYREGSLSQDAAGGRHGVRLVCQSSLPTANA